jgi:hypothetical protein
MDGDPEKRWFTIYAHTCDIDPRGSGERPTEGKQYVGQTVHGVQNYPDAAERAMMRRWRQHCREKTVFARAIRRLGPERFQHKIVDVVLGQTAANYAEIEWAEKLDSYEPRGYNRRMAGLQGAVTLAERSEFTRRGKSLVPPEERRASTLRGQQTLGPEGRRARSLKTNETIGPERRKEIARKRAATIDYVQIGKAISAGQRALGFEYLSARSLRGKATMGPERRSEAVRKSARTMGPDGRRARALRREDASGPEGRSARIRKAKATMGPEGRSAAAHKAIASQGPEGLKRRIQKAWTVRWAKALKLAEDNGDLEKAEKIRTSLDASLRARQLSSADLQRLRESLSTGATLKDLANQLRMPYLALYRALRRAEPKNSNDDFMITPPTHEAPPS